MEIRVDHYQTLFVKTHKVVNAFEQYKTKISALEYSFQIMTRKILDILSLFSYVNNHDTVHQ